MAKKTRGPRAYKRGEIWWGEWSDGRGGKIREGLRDKNGNKIRQASKSHEVQQALVRAYSRWLDDARGNDQPKANSEVTIAELSGQFVRSKGQGWSRPTAKAYKNYLERIYRYFGPATPVATISVKSAEEFKTWLQHDERKKRESDETLSPRSINNTIEFSRALFQYAFDLEITSRNPFRPIKALTVDQDRCKDPFTAEEIRALLNTAEQQLPYFYPVVLYLSLSASRRGSAMKLKIKDYDPQTRRIHQRSEISKQGKSNILQFPPHVAKIFEELCRGRDPEEPLFRTRTGRPLNAKVFEKPDPGANKIPSCRTWYLLLHKAGVRPRGPHNLRRAFVSNLASSDTTMEKITGVTGQTEEVAREIYLKLDVTAQEETIAKAAAIYGIPAPEISPASTESNLSNVSKIQLEVTPEQYQIIFNALESSLSTTVNPGTKSWHNLATLIENPRKHAAIEKSGGEGGIRTPATGLPRRTV